MRKKSPGRAPRGCGPRHRSDCPISYALDLVGDKWTLIVLRDLMFPRKRHFQELLDSPEKIASNILASRLKLLENAGLITRTADPVHARRVIYAPTAKALDLLPVLLEMLLWGTKHHARANAPESFVRRAAADRAGLIAELRAPYGAAK
jgi:DNA-binding HxlR family transcriptional regulator